MTIITSMKSRPCLAHLLFRFISTRNAATNVGEQKFEQSVSALRKNLPPGVIRRPWQLMKNQDEKPEPSFGLFERLDLKTKDRIHTVTITCDKVISLINLGAINKNIAIQYCHYLTSIAKDLGECEDKKYYSEKVRQLQSMLINRDIQPDSKFALLSNPCTIDETTCTKSCDLALSSNDICKSLPIGDFSELMKSCYKFQNWTLATKLLEKRSQEPSISGLISQPFADAFIAASLSYMSSNDNSNSSKTYIKDAVLSHAKILFSHYKQSHIIFEIENKQEFIIAFGRFDYEVRQNPNIKSTGRCINCDGRVPVYDHDNLNELHSSLKELLSRKYGDVHNINAPPGEISRFENFVNTINQKKRIDCVIDGPNISMRHGDIVGVKTTVQGGIDRRRRKQNPASSVVMLINTILRGNMLEKFKNILVIGKQHMYSWPGLIDFFNKHDIAYFLSKDDSKDDVFMLYAATLNPYTTLISCDLFRDHAFRLDDEQRLHFERWRDTHQAWVIQSTLSPIWPTPYSTVPTFDETTKSFHIPVVDAVKSEHSLSMNGPPPFLNPKALTWICCKPRVGILS